MHMTDFLIQHIQYVTLAPHPDRNSLDDLFRLLDTWMCLRETECSHGCTLRSSSPPQRKERQRQRKKGLNVRYNKFEEKFRHTAIGVFEPFLVHAAMTYTLAYLRECGDKACLDAVLHKSQSALNVLHRRIATGNIVA